MSRFSIFDLTGKVAIITGGYHGIGRGIADGLAEAGADVVICAINYERCVEACDEIGKMGVRTLAVRCDITKQEEVENRKFFESDIGQKVIRKNIPMERLGRIEELKGTAIYLASSATTFMTGACLVIDGGQTIW